MTNTFRKSKISAIISQLMGDEDIKAMMQDLGKALKGGAKEMFFNSLTEKGQKAFKLGFLLIENELPVIKAHEDSSIRENWYLHFIAYHDNVLEMLQEGGDCIFEFANEQHGEGHVESVFNQDPRSLEEIVDAVGKEVMEAKELEEKRESAIKEKIHNQLAELVDSLNDLTIAHVDGIKHFEIRSKGAEFKITLGNQGSQECTCGQCGEGEGNPFEELIKNLSKRQQQSH